MKIIRTPNSGFDRTLNFKDQAINAKNPCLRSTVEHVGMTRQPSYQRGIMSHLLNITRFSGNCDELASMTWAGQMRTAMSSG
jgi:hypothetical protein